MQPISALKNPNKANEPRWGRDVLPFYKALENLENAKSGSVKCVAFLSHVQCPNDIHFDYLDFLTLLGQLNITDVGSVVKLMPMMLCPAHWKETVYYNAMFLGSIFQPSSKLNARDFENAVIDLESAKFIKEEDYSALEAFCLSTSIGEGQKRRGQKRRSQKGRGQKRRGSPTSGRKEGNSFLNSNSIQIPTSYPDAELLPVLTLRALGSQTSDSVASSSDEEDFQIQSQPSGGDAPADILPEDEQTRKDIPDMLRFFRLRTYALLELGVAKLEIMYQTSLECISMDSSGWRCHELIQMERLLEARRFLSSISDSKDELNDLSKLVLCPDHSRGELPRLYSEAWSAFAGKRLPKKEAMTRFDPNYVDPVESPNNLTTGRIKPIEKRRDFNVPRTQPMEANTKSTSNWSPPPQLSERIKIPFPSSTHPERHITVRFPPNTSIVSNKVSNLSSEFAQVKLSGEASSHNRPGSVTSAVVKDVAVSKNTGSDSNTEPLPSSASLNFQRDLKKPVKMTHQGMIDGDLSREMRSPISRGGYVYVFKSLDQNLVKIGKTTNIAHQLEQIRAGCQLEDLREVNNGSYFVREPERVERLVHLELQNFRVNVICQHLHESSDEDIEQEHKEWFDIPEDVAIQSIQRWRKFVGEAYTLEGTLRDHWARKVHLIPMPNSLERAYLETGRDQSDVDCLRKHHELRHERYQDWMGSINTWWAKDEISW